MFKIFCDDTMICNSQIEELAVINPIVTLEVNTAGWFKFAFPAGHPYINEINHMTSVIRVERDNELLFQGFCSYEAVDLMGNKSIECEGELSYLNDSILRPHKYQGSMTVRDLLEAYIAEHNSQVEARKQFVVGSVTVDDPNNYIYCYTNMDTTMQSIKEDLIDDYGGYIFVRYADGVKYIDYLEEPTISAQQTIELGKNLITYDSNIDDSVIATRVIPLGATLDEEQIEGLTTRLDIKSVNDGKDYLDSQIAIDNFGIITKVAVFDDVTVPANLKIKGQQWLNDNQFENVVINVNAIDLSMIDSDFNQFKLFHRVHVISPYHGMDKWFMLSKININLNSPENDAYSLGKIVHSTLTVKTNNAASGINKMTEEMSGAESSWLKKAKKQATDLLSGVDGGYVVFNIDEQTGMPFEILVMDTPDKDTATKVWRWNQNGFGYSGTGYEGPYGTAITMNGAIVADYITAGTIRGITIEGNTINGGTINGTEFNASGSVKRYRSDYSQADVDRISGIQLATITPTMADYEKYDLNGNGCIDGRDKTIIRKLIRGDYGDYYELQCPVILNGSNKLGTVKTEKTMLTNGGIMSDNINIGNAFFVTTASGTPNRCAISVRDSSGTEHSGVTGDYTSNVRGIRVVNGLVTYVYTGS